MRPRLRPLLVMTAGLAILGAIANCGTNRAGVDTAHDTAIDFSQYKTYALHPDVEEAANSTSTVSHLAQAAHFEMGQKDFTKADAAEADILLMIHGGGEDQKALLKEAQREYGSAKEVANIYQYGRGVLIVDVIDREAERVVWRGVGESIYHGPGEELVANEMSVEKAKDAIEDVMAGFPPK